MGVDRQNGILMSLLLLVAESISDSRFQWKINFNPDPSTQTQETYHTLPFIIQVSKTVRYFISLKIFEECYQAILNKTNRSLGLLRKLQSLLPRASVIAI